MSGISVWKLAKGVVGYHGMFALFHKRPSEGTSSGGVLILQGASISAVGRHLINLGQILTYAAGLDVFTVVWIAKRFTDEHRATLDWLNEISQEGLNFFGLEIELWRIGDSLPAPKLNIVSKPNEWLKFIKTRTITGKDLSPAEQNWFDYWKSFGEFLDGEDSRFMPLKPRMVNWAGWGLGVADVGLSAVVRFSKNKGAEVQIDLSGPEAKERFGILETEKKAIEKELGFTLDWQERPDILGSRIVVTRNKDLNDRSAWPEIHRWMLDKMTAMEGAFRPRVVVFKKPTGLDDSAGDNSKPAGVDVEDR